MVRRFKGTGLKDPPPPPPFMPVSVHVKLVGGVLMSAAGGKTEFQLEAANIMQLLDRLGADHPELKPILSKGVAVAINGIVYRASWLQPIPKNAEVVIMPPLAGG
jgi:molybdopterin converting factor small subunit